MFQKIIRNKIILSIIAITMILMISISIYLPKVTEQNIINLVVKNSSNAVEQIKLTRAYYVEQIVGDIKEYAPNIKFDYKHDGIDGKIAFPTSLVHELSDIFTQNTGLKFQLYSNYPFMPKKDRILDPMQKEALNYIETHDKSIWVKRDVIDGEEVLRVAIADIMTQKACVSCHNSHKDKTWEAGKWKLGDKRGVLEVITPLTESLEANDIMKNKILFLIFMAMLILVIFYSFSLIKREKELIDENILLDEKVKNEVNKNMQKEKQLVQQSRSAAMGDMMGAIIHQWKQPLNGISMATSAIELQVQLGMADDEFLLSKIEDTKKQIDVMNTTMDDFRNFFKPQDALVYDINISIDDTLKLVSSIYEKEKISIETDYEDGLFTLGYPNEINQVIINVLNNARDIILEKDSEVKTVMIRTYKAGDNIKLTITDCAGGVPEDIIDKIFEPYITTKSDDKGTGIGLDMSKTIIEKVDGKIEVQNVETKVEDKVYMGASFIITLPISSKKSK